MQEFFKNLSSIGTDEELLDFCRRRILHGTPKVFENNEEGYYKFRKRIADKFDISFHEVFIVGSAKLGFSPHKRKLFDYESDIDVSIISSNLYEKIMSYIHDYQVQLKMSRRSVSKREIDAYHNFLEYGAIGWMRPDLLPTSFRIDELKKDWFDFFNSISFGHSEVGNYKVAAGAFKSYKHLEKYSLNSIASVQKSITLDSNKIYVTSNST